MSRHPAHFQNHVNVPTHPSQTNHQVVIGNNHSAHQVANMSMPMQYPQTQRPPHSYTVGQASSLNGTLQALVTSSRNDERVVNDKTNELKALQHVCEEMGRVKRDFFHFAQFVHRQLDHKSADVNLAKARLQDIKRLRVDSEECLNHHAALVARVNSQLAELKPRLAAQQARLTELENRRDALDKLRERLSHDNALTVQEIEEALTEAVTLRRIIAQRGTESSALSRRLADGVSAADAAAKSVKEYRSAAERDNAAARTAKEALAKATEWHSESTAQLTAVSDRLASALADIAALEEAVTHHETQLARRSAAEKDHKEHTDKCTAVVADLATTNEAQKQCDAEIAALDEEVRRCRVEIQLLEQQLAAQDIDELNASLLTTTAMLQKQQEANSSFAKFHAQEVESLLASVDAEFLAHEHAQLHVSLQELATVHTELARAQARVTEYGEAQVQARQNELEALNATLAGLVASANTVHALAGQLTWNEEHEAVVAQIAEWKTKVTAEETSLATLQAEQTKLYREVGQLREKTEQLQALKKENDDFARVKADKLAEHVRNNVEPAKAQAAAMCEKLQEQLDNATRLLAELDAEEASAAAEARAAAAEALRVAQEEEIRAKLQAEQEKAEQLAHAKKDREDQERKLEETAQREAETQRRAAEAAANAAITAEGERERAAAAEDPFASMQNVTPIADESVMGSIDEMELPTPTVALDEPATATTSGYRSPPFKQRYTPFQPSPRAQTHATTAIPAALTTPAQAQAHSPAPAHSLPNTPVYSQALPASPAQRSHHLQPHSPSAAAVSPASVSHTAPHTAPMPVAVEDAPQPAPTPVRMSKKAHTPQPSRLAHYMASPSKKQEAPSATTPASGQKTGKRVMSTKNKSTKEEIHYETPRRTASPKMASPASPQQVAVRAAYPAPEPTTQASSLVLKRRMSPTLQRVHHSPQRMERAAQSASDDKYDLMSASQAERMSPLLSVRKNRMLASPPPTPARAASVDYSDDENSQSVSNATILSQYDMYDDHDHVNPPPQKKQPAYSPVVLTRTKAAVPPVAKKVVHPPTTSALQSHAAKEPAPPKVQSKSAPAAPRRSTGTASTIKPQSPHTRDLYASPVVSTSHLLSKHLSQMSKKSEIPMFSDSSDDSDDGALVTYRNKPAAPSRLAVPFSPDRILSKYSNQETPLQRFTKQKHEKQVKGQTASRDLKAGILSHSSASDDPYELDIFS